MDSELENAVGTDLLLFEALTLRTTEELTSDYNSTDHETSSWELHQNPARLGTLQNYSFTIVLPFAFLWYQ